MDAPEKKSFRDTLNLPTTTFPIRPQAAIDDPALCIRWEQEGLFDAAGKLNAGNPKFVLHFGPPYANGHIHTGHALTETLKDFVCKAKRMTGLHVKLVPGWDCHGLPIEFKVAAELGVSKDTSGVDPIEFKEKCRVYAQQWIEVQRAEFKQLGIVATWDHPYITMNFTYEADILRALAMFVKKGHIERKGKTVPWCFTCQTVLASAEIEYKDRKDPSCYIAFPFETESAERLFPAFAGREVSMLVWTTTPWTIPLNRGVMVHPTAAYVLFAGKDGKLLVVGQERLADIAALCGVEPTILATVNASDFGSAYVHHPLTNRRTPLIFDVSVGLNDGTAAVHTAPGCGPDDYLIGLKNGLEIFSPLSADGKYTAGIDPVELEGMPITDGQWWVLKKLDESGRLVHKSNISHSYPHCWRCHNGLMFRATDQWFCNLEKNDLLARTLLAAEKIEFIPEWGKNRFLASVGTRTEWCISRQRMWGVPIPALLNTKTGEAIISAELIEKVADGVAQESITYWDRLTIEQMRDQGMISKELYDAHCDENGVCQLIKEDDILDVWFDSGVSHFAVLAKDPELSMPADLYLEGSDQHRGWFQSSILSSMIMNDMPPMKQILTHGFVVDDERHKMSKSVGNVIAPDEVIKKYGVDVLRLWVASADYERDVVISTKVLDNVAEVYRKIRNTARFLLSNLYDFDITRDAVPLEKMRLIDQQALARLHEVATAVLPAYDEYRFTAVVQELNTYCANDLSASYLDMIKDCLYTEKSDGDIRRSAQTALYRILDTLTHLMAPVLSYTAEHIAACYRAAGAGSIHLSKFPQTVDVWEALGKKNETTAAGWHALQELRSVVLKAIEQRREAGEIKQSLEARVVIFIDQSAESTKSLRAILADIAKSHDVIAFLKEWCIVSQLELSTNSSAGDLSAEVEHARGTKCPRCWQWDEIVDEDGLCRRCVHVLKK